MNPSPNVDLVLHDYFADDGSSAPDHVLRVVEERIARQPQRRPWRVSWRDSHVNGYLKYAAAVATVLVVAVIGYNLLPRGSTGGSGPTSSPTENPTSSPAASPTGSQGPTATASQGPTPLFSGELPAGTYETRPYTNPAIGLTFTMPGGWEGFESWGLIGPGSNGTREPDGIGLNFSEASALYSDPCHWDATGSFPQPGDIPVGPTVDDLVAALRANPAYVASAPSDVMVDGYAGKQLDLQLPSDVDFATCGNVMGSGANLVWAPPATETEVSACCVMAGPLALGPGSRWHLRILDVEGTRVIILIGDYAGTPAADQAAAQAIVDSIQITP